MQQRSKIGCRLECALTRLAGMKIYSPDAANVVTGLNGLTAEKASFKKEELLDSLCDVRFRLFEIPPDEVLDFLTRETLERLFDEAVAGKGKCCDECGGETKSAPCIGCGKKNRIQPAEGPPLQFVWVYFHNGAKSDELRWSMRSVETHYQGKAKLLVIGDKAPWYDGPLIHCPRVRLSKGFRRGLRDVLHKMSILSEHPGVEDNFVWMMDDVFMLQPTSMEQLQQPRAGGRISSNRSNGWRGCNDNTRQRLKELGKSAWDFATHLPHYVSKQKLKELFGLPEWNPHKEIYLWECAYHNYHGHTPSGISRFLARLKSERSPEQYDDIAANHHFLNVYSSGWKDALRNWLIRRFPTKHSGESGDPPGIVKRHAAPPRLDRSYLCIRSAYDDEVTSRMRLEMSLKTVIPSLRSQTRKARLVVMLRVTDPLLSERKEAFRSTGMEVDFRFRKYPVTSENLYAEDYGIASGLRVAVTRCDDDDILPVDFLELTLDAAERCDWDRAMLEWPNGYVMHRNRLHRYTMPANQFITVVSNKAINPVVDDHYRFRYTLPTVVVNSSRGWIWNRHPDTISLRQLGEMPTKYSQQTGGRPNRARWPVKLP